VCVVSTPGGDWLIEKSLGYGNEELSTKTLQLIVCHLKTFTRK
jgi:hypothetical protein